MIALAAVIAAVALLALAIFGDGSSYQVKGIFQNAGQLVNGNQVRVGGKPVGTISDIELNDRAQAVVTMNLDDEFSPAARGNQRDDPRDVPVRDREPLHLPEPRAEQRRGHPGRRRDRRR